MCRVPEEREMPVINSNCLKNGAKNRILYYSKYKLLCDNTNMQKGEDHIQIERNCTDYQGQWSVRGLQEQQEKSMISVGQDLVHHC